MNDTIKSIHDRFSCRGFEPNKNVADSDINTIMQAALASPSAWNSQSWHFVVCKNQELIKKAEKAAYEFVAGLQDQSIYEYVKKSGGKIFYDAPVVVFVTRPDSEQKSESVNSGIALQSMSLAATSLGVDNLMCGFTAMCFASPQAEELKQALKFPKGYICNVAILLGHGLEKANKPPHELDNSKITTII